jgi:hypothetical protein
VCTANAGGVTTKNSTYPRSELREMNGDEMASWSNRTGTHTLTCGRPSPSCRGEARAGHSADPRRRSDVMEVRLEDKRLIARYADGEKEFVVDPTTPWARRTTCSWSRRTGASTSLQRQARGSIPQSGSGLVLQDGSYLQSNTEKGDAADAVGKVVLYQYA